MKALAISTCLVVLLASPIKLAHAPAMAQDTRNAELALSDEKLNLVYGRIMKQISAEKQKALKAAQRAWIAMRDADCKWAFVDIRDCLIDRTDNRTNELQETYFQWETGEYQSILSR